MERKWLLPLIASSLLSIILFLAGTVSLGASSRGARVWGFLAKNDPSRVTYVEDYLVQRMSSDMPPPPRLAYLISGTRGDGLRMKRVLQAIYHPRNHYILHLDLDAPPRERVELARWVRLDTTFIKVGNVFMVGKANLVTYRGSTMIATTLHAAAILLKRKSDFDWFINLSASDYPLITQDGQFSIFVGRILLKFGTLRFFFHDSKVKSKQMIPSTETCRSVSSSFALIVMLAFGL